MRHLNIPPRFHHGNMLSRSLREALNIPKGMLGRLRRKEKLCAYTSKLLSNFPKKIRFPIFFLHLLFFEQQGHLFLLPVFPVLLPRLLEQHVADPVACGAKARRHGDQDVVWGIINKYGKLLNKY